MDNNCLRYLRELTEIRPDHADCWNDLGLALVSSHQNVGAEAAFNRALEINPQYLEARISRAFLYGAMDRAPHGLREFRQICLADPDNFKTVFPLGIYCMRYGWKETGLAQLDRAAEMRPKSPFVSAARATALRELGKECSAPGPGEEIVDLFRRLGIDCSSANVPDSGTCADWENPFLRKLRILQVDVLNAEGRADTAEAELFSANRETPGDSSLMVAMGRLLIARQRPQEAREWLSAATVVDGCCDQAHFELSFLHVADRDTEAAVEAARSAVSLRPLFPDYRYHLGTVLTATGAIDEAISEFRYALVLKPDFGHCSMQLANAYLEKESPEEALRVLSCGAPLDWPEALVVAAQAHLKNGQAQEAKRKLEQALACDPSVTEAREMLAELAV